MTKITFEFCGSADCTNFAANWIKPIWPHDTPAYKTKEFDAWLESQGMTMDEFKQRDSYRKATWSGLIMNDEWTGIREWLGGGTGKEFTFEQQVEIRLNRIRQTIQNDIITAQTLTGRALTKKELGQRIKFAAQIDFTIASSSIRVGSADVTGMSGLEDVDSESVWAMVLTRLNGFFVDELLAIDLPVVKLDKSATTAAYFPERNLIVIPPSTTPGWEPAVVHVLSHHVDRMGRSMEAISMVRNRLVSTGPLHRIRPGLYALRGPWLDPYDGVIHGAEEGWLEQQYENKVVFTPEDAQRLFPGGHTEFYSMAAERFARSDDIEIAEMYTRCPEQVYMYMSVSAGHYIFSGYEWQ